MYIYAYIYIFKNHKFKQIHLILVHPQSACTAFLHAYLYFPYNNINTFTYVLNLISIIVSELFYLHYYNK